MKELMSFFAVSRDDYSEIRREAWEESWLSLRLVSAIAAIAFGIMTGLGLLMTSYGKNVTIYAVYTVLSAVFWGISFLKTDSLPLKASACYGCYAMLLSMGIVMGTLISPDMLTVSFIVMMLGIPLLFTFRSWICNAVMAVCVIIYCAAAKYTQPPEIFSVNMLNVIPYSIISMFVTSATMRSKMQRVLMRTRLQAEEEARRATEDRMNRFDAFITDMVRYATSEEELEKIVEQLVEYIGEKLHSDRAYIFEKNEKGGFDNTYEWCREGVSAEKDNLQNVPFEGVIEPWYTQYKKTGSVIIEDIEEYKKVSLPIYNLLKPQGVETLVTGPIIIEGKMVGFYGVDNPPRDMIHDISDLICVMEFVVSFIMRIRDNASELAYSAVHDQLTGCKNRKALEWLYRKQYDENGSLAVLMCDLNSLKEINDRQGHDAGDKFIRRTAEVLQSVFGTEHVYRMGGDEFAAIIAGISQKEFSEKIELSRILLGNTASLGVAYRETMCDVGFDAVLKDADVAMYHQKGSYYANATVDRRRRRTDD